MFNLIALPKICRICLYLPAQLPVKLLQRELEAEGLTVFHALTTCEFENAILTQHFTAIVTTSPLVEQVRAYCLLPIIDIQPLIDDWKRNHGREPPTTFEKPAFLQGVTFTATRHDS
ncbi:MAG: hypothetical protein QM684_09680 [Rhizobium sp.]|uniref:hypothetical protein n=1 Tax=Rhizobium sp. SYY.PMSO TaxID=3382192 RepID=UPI00398FA6EB